MALAASGNHFVRFPDPQSLKVERPAEVREMEWMTAARMDQAGTRFGFALVAVHEVGTSLIFGWHN